MNLSGDGTPEFVPAKRVSVDFFRVLGVQPAVGRGFTPEEFQALDFSSMDLSEYFNELALNAGSTMQSIVQGGVTDYVATNGVN